MVACSNSNTNLFIYFRNCGDEMYTITTITLVIFYQHNIFYTQIYSFLRISIYKVHFKNYQNTAISGDTMFGDAMKNAFK